MKIVFGLSKKYAFYVKGMAKYSFVIDVTHGSFPKDLRPLKILDYLKNRHASIKWIETKSLHTNKPLYSFYFDEPEDEAFFLVWSNDNLIDIN